MRFSKTLPLLLIAIASLRAEAPPVEGTLPEDYLPGLRPLLKQAVEQSPTTITASIALAQAEAGRYLQSAALWPSVNLGSSYQDTTEKISQGTTSKARGLQYNGNVTQPLFEWGALKNQAQIGALGVKIAEKQFAEAYRQLAVTIREQYMGLVGKKLLLRNARFGQKMADEALATQLVRLEAGSVSEADVQGFRLALEEAKLGADRAEEDYNYGKRLFIRLVGIDSLSEDSVPAELPHPEFSPVLADTVLAGFVGSGIESTFQNQVYRMMLEEQDKSYKIASVRLLPRVSASAGFSKSNQTSVSRVSISQVAVQEENYSIAANWTIFDGFSSKGQKLSALAQKRSYERVRQTYVDSTIDTIADMRRQIGFASRAMGLAEVRNALIEVEVKRLGDDRNLGYASQATIDAGIVTLNATQYNMAFSRSDYLSRWTEFVSLAGIDPVMANVSQRYAR